jgi:hypothetical protein
VPSASCDTRTSLGSAPSDSRPRVAQGGQLVALGAQGADLPGDQALPGEPRLPEAGAFALYHERVRAARSTEWLDIVDAAALLWRLSLYGTDVAAPATALAADISDLVDVPVYLFNDWHAVMAFGLAGDHARVARVLLTNRSLAGPTNRRAADRAGHRLLEGFAAFAAGEPETAVDLLIDIKPEAHAVGGSHAQRDVIDLTLIAAATRSGQAGLARALVAERTARKPPAAPSARALVLANGGDETWLAW